MFLSGVPARAWMLWSGIKVLIKEGAGINKAQEHRVSCVCWWRWGTK